MLAAAIMRDGKEGVLILIFFSFFILEKKQFHPQYAMPSISALLCPLMLRLEGAAAVLFKVSTSVFFGFKTATTTTAENTTQKYNGHHKLNTIANIDYAI